MFVLNFSDDYNNIINNTQNEKNHINIIIKYLLLSMPSAILLL